MSICHTFADLGICSEPTTILGDIEAWALAYLDTGLHVDDWLQRMAQQRKLLDKYQRESGTVADASVS